MRLPAPYALQTPTSYCSSARGRGTRSPSKKGGTPALPPLPSASSAMASRCSSSRTVACSSSIRSSPANGSGHARRSPSRLTSDPPRPLRTAQSLTPSPRSSVRSRRSTRRRHPLPTGLTPSTSAASASPTTEARTADTRRFERRTPTSSGSSPTSEPGAPHTAASTEASQLDRKPFTPAPSLSLKRAESSSPRDPTP